MTIYTDEHKSYSALFIKGFLHSNVFHKYEFVDEQNGANTQAVESFNNELKLLIKKQKGIKNANRKDFLKEFCFYFNNKQRFLCAIFDLLKYS
ncbi:hypothetical protein H312_00982 [Anncaliia algerae PRA339]|uniref:ISXO2-like transposase domain-containing protein n=1 Tax=Anncaliia algerae PRA339 TaxID=1288291 RepID=A0A059F2W8_9MICR|nr:hypothetical protein H312_00982 [Anncaliia algerae PRA339]